jgi:hypothetical protein
MKIKLLRNIGIDGKHCKAGTIVEVSHSVGKDIIGSGRASEVLETVKEKPKPAPETDKPAK